MKKQIIFGSIIPLLFLVVMKSVGQDSLKVHIVGYFKNEVYRIYNDSNILTIESKKGKKQSINRMQGFTFKIFVQHSDSIDSKILNLVIKRKTWYGIYRDVKLYIPYDNQDYLVIHRIFKTKNKYSFYYYWTCTPPRYVMNNSFWEFSNCDWSIDKSKEINTEGKVNVYDYINYSWSRRIFEIW